LVTFVLIIICWLADFRSLSCPKVQSRFYSLGTWKDH